MSKAPIEGRPEIGSVRDRTRRRSVVAVAVVLSGAALALFARLGGPIYEAHDVARTAQMVHEMHARDTLVPTLMSRPYFEAAPLAVWAPYAAAHLLGGLTPLAVRVPSALAWFATIVLTLLLGRRVSPRVGVIAASAMTLNYLTIQYARGSRVEGLLGLAVAAAIGAFLMAGERVAWRRHAWHALAGVALAVAIAAKGPYAAAIVGAVLLAFAVLERQLRRDALGVVVMGGVALLLSAAWLVPYAHYLGPAESQAFFDQLLLRETVAKFRDGYGKAAPFYAYLVAVPWKLAPWSLLAIVPLIVHWRRRADTPRIERLCACWLVAPLILLSFASGKHIRYVVPMLPAMSILAAIALDRWLASPSRRVAGAIRGAAILFGGLVVATGGAGLVAYALLYGADATSLLTCGLAVAAGAAAWQLARRGRSATALLAVHTGACALVAFAFAAVFTLPASARAASAHYRLASELDAVLLPGEPVVITDSRRIDVDPDQLSLYLPGHAVSVSPRRGDIPRSAPVLAPRVYRGTRVRAVIDWERGGRARPSFLLESVTSRSASAPRPPGPAPSAPR